MRKKSIFFSTHITSDLDKIADYITFINKGKIIFSSTMNTIQDEYKLVKGTKEVLNAIDPSLFVSVQRNNFGFQALTNRTSEVIASASDVLIEPANLEDIMFFHSKL